jgi:hypothetical protein
MAMGPDGVRNQERLCWRGLAAIYWTGIHWKVGEEFFPELLVLLYSISLYVKDINSH